MLPSNFESLTDKHFCPAEFVHLNEIYKTKKETRFVIEELLNVSRKSIRYAFQSR